MKKYLANILSLSRIPLAFILFCCKEINALFLSVYIICGFTDFIDGPIARKTNSSSSLGAAFDTVGDMLTYLALTKILVANKLVPVWVLIWIISAGVLFVICTFISKYRFQKFYLPHTYLGKIFGGTIFLLPFAIKIIPKDIYLSIICSIATTNAVELLLIQLKNKTAEPFVPSVFHIKKSLKHTNKNFY